VASRADGDGPAEDERESPSPGQITGGPTDSGVDEHLLATAAATMSRIPAIGGRRADRLLDLVLVHARPETEEGHRARTPRSRATAGMPRNSRNFRAPDSSAIVSSATARMSMRMTGR
jgi:hypothetical protein